jgi:hypothetical protein
MVNNTVIFLLCQKYKSHTVIFIAGKPKIFTKL